MSVSKPLISDWLALVRQLIPGLEHAYVHLEGSAIPGDRLTVTYPDDLPCSDEHTLSATLASTSGNPVTSTVKSTTGDTVLLRVAYPLVLGECSQGAIVVGIDAKIDKQPAILSQLQWCEKWLNFSLVQTHEKPPILAYRQFVEGASLQPSYEDATTFVLALLPHRTDSTRVSLGRVTQSSVEVEAVSEAGSLDARSQRVTAISDAMLEAHNLGKTVSWSRTSSDASLYPQHSRLSDIGVLAAVCTVPTKSGTTSSLVFCFEFVQAFKDSAKRKEQCEEAVSVIAPVLELQYETGRVWWRRAIALSRQGLCEITSSNKRFHKLGFAISLLMVCAFAFSHGEYRVRAPAMLEGLIQRAVVAPFDGYLLEADVQASHQVTKGDVMAKLDDRELLGERRQLTSKGVEYAEQHRQAVASLDHGSAKIIRTQADQVNAKLALIDAQLNRTTLRAPLDGVVIFGDWSRALGAPVAKGELLFQVSPLDQYRVTLQVNDKDIGGIRNGQQGVVVLSARPKEKVPFKVTRVSSISQSETGEPAFRVEGSLIESAQELRPGMQGIARVSVGERRRWWIWTHAISDWLRMQIWRVWP